MDLKLLTPLKVGETKLANRVVMAPLTRCRTAEPDNVPTELNAEYYAQRATAGLIISEATQISRSGQGYAGSADLYRCARGRMEKSCGCRACERRKNVGTVKACGAHVPLLFPARRQSACRSIGNRCRRRQVQHHCRWSAQVCAL